MSRTKEHFKPRETCFVHNATRMRSVENFCVKLCGNSALCGAMELLAPRFPVHIHTWKRFPKFMTFHFAFHRKVFMATVWRPVLDVPSRNGYADGMGCKYLACRTPSAYCTDYNL